MTSHVHCGPNRCVTRAILATWSLVGSTCKHWRSRVGTKSFCSCCCVQALVRPLADASWTLYCGDESFRFFPVPSAALPCGAFSVRPLLLHSVSRFLFWAFGETACTRNLPNRCLQSLVMNVLDNSLLKSSPRSISGRCVQVRRPALSRCCQPGATQSGQ